MNDLEKEQVKTIVRGHWGDKLTDIQLGSFVHAAREHEVGKILLIIDEVARKHGFNTFPLKKLNDGIEKLPKPKPPYIHVYALRDDGKHVTLCCPTDESSHARNIICMFMRKYWNQIAREPEKGEDHFDPEEFVFYIGEENFKEFLFAMTNISIQVTARIEADAKAAKDKKRADQGVLVRSQTDRMKAQQQSKPQAVIEAEYEVAKSQDELEAELHAEEMF